jgi:hypothetical protein
LGVNPTPDNETLKKLYLFAIALDPVVAIVIAEASPEQTVLLNDGDNAGAAKTSTRTVC